MHQEFNTDILTYPRAKIHRLLNPTFRVARLMEDGLEDVTVGICDVGVLPGVIDAECGITIPVLEVKLSVSRNRSKLLIERAVPEQWSCKAAKLQERRVAARECGEDAVVRENIQDFRRRVGVINNPATEITGLESAVMD